MDDEVDLSNYEQADPNFPTEEETLDRANQRLKESLRKIAETEERMKHNVGRHPDNR